MMPTERKYTLAGFVWDLLFTAFVIVVGGAGLWGLSTITA